MQKVNIAEKFNLFDEYWSLKIAGEINDSYVKLAMVIFLMFTLTGCSASNENIKIDSKIKSGKDINFFVTSDIHYLGKSLTDRGNAFQDYVSNGDGKQLDDIDEIVSTLSYEIKNKKPEVLIISGDLTNNGEKDGHLELSKRLKEIEDSGTEVFVIPGNHDILNRMASSFDGDDQYTVDNISSKEFSEIYGDFGYKEAVSRDKDTLSYLAAPSEDIWLLMIDTSQYKDNLNSPFPRGDGEISKDTFKWIKKCSTLAKKNGAQIITVMHHNLFDHSEVLQKGYTLNNSKEAMEVFDKLGLNLIFSGHIHAQDIRSNKKGENTTYDIASGSLAVYPQQYGILKYSSKDSALDYSTSRLDVESWATATKAERKSLYNFKSNSEKFFGQVAYDRSYKQLMQAGGYSKEQINLMSETKKLLNLRYFAGTESLNSKDVINSEGYNLWTKSAEGFQRDYIKSMITDKDTDDNNLHIELKKSKK